MILARRAVGKSCSSVPLIEGDVVELDAGDSTGRAQQGRRPALIVSVNALQSALGLAIVCAVATHGGRPAQARNDLEVLVPPGLAITGVILPHQLRTIDLRARNATRLATVPRVTLLAGRALLNALLGV